ncbi:E3 ubiquitin-protein ligase RHA2A-like [Phragmites australis]|uniref:E3 ubiquitin-protein ligase RHA2A-like n=1 Tax=Phragmites australis TaxID=29695 RepID=UPI002D77C25A|nr:E3 ubiquitin-protein ligase RHA2A-like [Phragmites australis]
MVLTMSQVVALLSSALSGSGGGGGVAIGKVPATDGERWRRCGGGGHDRSAGPPGYCCVCISTCRDGEEIRKLPCGHAFHRDCVDRWLAQCRRTCPLCRLHVGGVGLQDEQHQLSEDLVIWFSSLFVAGL